ncbi:MAG: biphenyl 2,3-dioxygenase [Gammaproteobacteria bacterium]|uniref:VOC family protein n=1 Tax=Pseudomaricurvus alcaniphilus TaxID=1166482 RepID=UPI001408EB2A|nr:VOC family protein [Pseudomaricurvus alcaniphilus]MBR9912973.1 biphenyl 2,3-dioxygenase [Gammaproteobacteria bacterium]NHN36455.1 biphenyl 2,3-dioxygenase [Pseudomaricurvus alcaniphilus]
MSINSLGYIGVYSSDLAQWAEYGTQVLGMENVTPHIDDNTGNLYLKMDERPWRLLVIPSEQDRFGFCGWECNSAQALQDTVDRLRSAGVEVAEASAGETALRRVQRLVKFRDPTGNQHEAYWGVVADFRRLVSPVGVRSFVTGKLGMGHVVLPAPDFDITVGFFRDVLGFGLSDLMNIRFTDDPAEPNKRLWFMHCNSRHHSLGLFEMPHPAGCVHLMLEVENIDEVGRCEDRRIAHGVPLSATLGRHANDQMVSFYMKSPSNFDIEYGAEGLCVDNWDNYSNFESTVPSYWGHDFSVGQG